MEVEGAGATADGNHWYGACPLTFIGHLDADAVRACHLGSRPPARRQSVETIGKSCESAIRTVPLSLSMSGFVAASEKLNGCGTAPSATLCLAAERRS